MALELLTREDVRDVLRQELPAIIAALLPKQDEAPITAAEVCSHFNISRSTLTKYRDQGKIPFQKIGGVYRYEKSLVKEALTKNNII